LHQNALKRKIKQKKFSRAPFEKKRKAIETSIETSIIFLPLNSLLKLFKKIIRNILYYTKYYKKEKNLKNKIAYEI
jgi:hypothetical protein